MANIGEWTEDRLSNWMFQRFNLQGNVRTLINRAVADAAVPTGQLGWTARASAPDGWIAAQGQVLSQAAYTPLFDAIGAVYNTGGEAAGEFRLPDLRGRALFGLGTHADVDALTDGDGLAVGSRTPSHRHHKGTIQVGNPIHAALGAPGVFDGGGTTEVTPWTNYYNGHKHDVPAFDTDFTSLPYAVGLGIIKL